MLRSASTVGFSLFLGLSFSGSLAMAQAPRARWLPPLPRRPPPLSKAQIMAAKTFFDRGQKLYNEGKYEAAWIEFSSAYEIARRCPTWIFNLARCEVKMGRTKKPSLTTASSRRWSPMIRRHRGLPEIESMGASATGSA